MGRFSGPVLVAELSWQGAASGINPGTGKEVGASVMWLSELESTLIDDGMGWRDKCKREDNFPLTYRTALVIRLFLNGLSLDMMMIGKRECSMHTV